jgi:hypothetical protein
VVRAGNYANLDETLFKCKHRFFKKYKLETMVAPKENASGSQKVWELMTVASIPNTDLFGWIQFITSGTGLGSCDGLVR